MELNERKLRILRSIIDEYIERGEPVGSKHLLEQGNFSLSSATIRNEMSDLEEMGYLDKPHASSGRIPSSNAYRLYVDELMREYKAGEEQLDLLAELTKFKSDEMDKIVTKARQIMSSMTGYATITMPQSDGQYVISRFETMHLDSYGMLLVMIMPDSTVNTKHLSTGVPITPADAAKIKNALNLVLASRPLSEVSLPMIMQLEESFGELKSLVNPILRVAYEAVTGNVGKSVEVDGITNLLSYPEFKNVERVKDLLELLDTDSDNLRGLIPAKTDNESAFKVYIGDDGDESGLSDASIVFCSLPVGNKNTVFGVLGPKRMDYKKVAEALMRLSQTMQRLLPENKKTDITLLNIKNKTDIE